MQDVLLKGPMRVAEREHSGQLSQEVSMEGQTSEALWDIQGEII